MTDNLGVCKGPGDILGQLYIGSDDIYISKIGRYLYSLLNKRAIMMARSKKELFERMIPVLSFIIKNMSKNAQLNAIKWRYVNKNYTEMVNEMLKYIKENLRPVELFVLELKPDEIQDNTKIYKSAVSVTRKKEMIENLDEYRITLIKLGINLNNLLETADSLLRTSLDKSIWGSNKITMIINNIKTDIHNVDDFEVIEGCLEHSDKYASDLQMIIDNNISTPYAIRITGKVIENFSILKSFISMLAKSLLRLYNIDPVFKSCIGYPATWFFNSSVFHDFLFEFETLIDHLIKSASLESKVIEPLLLWKIKTKPCSLSTY